MNNGILYKKQKLFLCTLGLIMIFVLCLFEKIDGNIFWLCFGFDIGLFCGANVAKKFANRDKK